MCVWFAFTLNTCSFVSKQPSACQDPVWLCKHYVYLHAHQCDLVIYVCLWTLAWLFIGVEMASAGTSYSEKWLWWLTDHICFQSKQKQCRSNPKTTGTWWLSLNVIIPLCSVCMRGPCACFSTLCLFQCVQGRPCLTLEASSKIIAPQQAVAVFFCGTSASYINGNHSADLCPVYVCIFAYMGFLEYLSWTLTCCKWC